MNTTLVVVLVVVGVVVVSAVIAWLLRKSGFTVREVTAKLPLVEAKMEREPGGETPSPPAAPAPAAPPRTEASIDALRGGQVEDSNISLPADSGAKAKIKAEGKDSSISNSDIEITR